MCPPFFSSLAILPEETGESSVAAAGIFVCADLLRGLPRRFFFVAKFVGDEHLALAAFQVCRKGNAAVLWLPISDSQKMGVIIDFYYGSSEYSNATYGAMNNVTASTFCQFVSAGPENGRCGHAT